MTELNVPYLHVYVDADDVELASLALWELGALGVEERDETTIMGSDSGVSVTLAAPFATEARARAALKQLSEHYNTDLAHIMNEDWSRAWKDGLEPTCIGRRLYLCPSWVPTRPNAGRVQVTMDPENAFGSGTHETTRLVLRELDRRLHGQERVLDVGCGSGVLAIAALKLGAASAVATDTDADAVTVSRKNGERNGVADRLEVTGAPVSSLDGEYDMIVANIHASALQQLAGDLMALLAPEGTLVLSGILATDWRKVASSYEGLPLLVVTKEGEWACLTFRRGQR